MGDFEVVVRDPDGDPVVIRNAPLLDDGTPMPTRYWLVGAAARRAVDRLEAGGGVRQAERELDADAVRRAHEAYAAERDAAVPPGWGGPRPSGGVGGTRTGIKCLHAHYAWYLAGGPDPVGRWVAERLAAGPGPGSKGAPEVASEVAPAAAIDCGTNSTRLLIARPGGPQLERVNRITRLGQGVDHTRRLAPDAIERTAAALRDYRLLMDDHGVGPVRVTATSAARDALNRDEFFDEAERIVGVRPELLPGAEEGRLSFAGATADLDPAGGPWLVVDIGGGSTELVIGPGPDGGPVAVRSLDVGCVRLTERFLAGDPPSAAELAAARAHVVELLDSTVADQPEFLDGATLVGLAGTVACLAAVDQGLDGYDRDRVHHYRLRADRVAVVLDRFSAMTADERRRVPGVEEARADVIVGGTVVLAEVMTRFGFAECLTSEADILDGLVLSTARTI